MGGPWERAWVGWVIEGVTCLEGARWWQMRAECEARLEMFVMIPQEP